MRNAVLTGIVAGTMGYATLAGARETAPVTHSVEFELRTMVAQANQVAAQVAEMQEQLATLEAMRDGFLARLRNATGSRGSAAADEAVQLQFIIDRVNAQIDDLQVAIAEMQQTLARLTNTIRRMTSSGVLRQPLG